MRADPQSPEDNGAVRGRDSTNFAAFYQKNNVILGIRGVFEN